MMKQKRTYATERINALRTIPKPSEYIWSIYRLRPCPVVLYVRVSNKTQKENLLHQITHLKTELEKRGFTVIAVHEEIVPGWESIGSERQGRPARPKLDLAILKAKVAKAVVVACSVDRFTRSWDPKWRKGQPQPSLSVFEFKRLIDEADGIQLATLLHPDTPPEQVRSAESKRGQAGKGNYGGRPKEEFPLKARRLRLLPFARALWKKGFSYRQIGAKLKTPWSTVRDWIKRKPRTGNLLAST